MKSNLKVQSNLSTLGINKPKPGHLKLTHEREVNLSPKEIWQRKEKQLKLKGLMLLLLTQLFWVIIFLSDDDPVRIQAPKLGIEKGHELIKLSASISSQLPEPGNKTQATLFREGSPRTIAVLLRGYEEDPLGQTGIKAILEVPKDQLHFIKNYKHTWQVFPPMTKSVQNHKRSIYEINF